MFKKWMISMLMLLIGSSSLFFLLFEKNRESYNYQQFSSQMSINSKLNNPELIAEIDNPTNLDVYILDDINKAKPMESTFSVTGTATYHKSWQRRWWGWLNEVSSTSEPVALSPINSVFSTRTTLNNQNYDNFVFNWTGMLSTDSLEINGSYQIDSINTNYGSFKMDHGPSPIILRSQIIPAINVNVNEEAGKNEYIPKLSESSKYTERFAFYKKNTNKQNIINNLVNDFNAKGRRTGENWPHAEYARHYTVDKDFGQGYTSSFYAFSGRDAIQAKTNFSHLDADVSNKLNNRLIAALAIDKNLFGKLTKIHWDKLKFSDYNDKTWNAVTIKNNTKNILNFSQDFWWLKTLASAANLLKKINEEIIKPASGHEINVFAPLNNPNLVDNFFATLSWDNSKTPYKMSDIRLLVGEINKLKFPDFDTLRQYSESFLLRPNDGFIGFPIGNGEFGTIWKNKLVNINNSAFITDKNSNIFLDNWTLDDWSQLYDGIINIFKSYNAVITAEVWDTNARKWITVKDIDNNGMEDKVKEVTVWDGEKGQWNYDFINDIGENFIKQNILEFRIKEYRVVPTTHKSPSNNATIVGLDSLTPVDQQDFSVRLKYRYNAMPFDLLVLNSKYDPKWAKNLSIFSDKTINQLVHMDNGSSTEIDDEGNEIMKQWYVNDFISNNNYDPKKIILKSLNDNLRAYVMKIPQWDNGYNGYPIFGEVLSGIGIGDLNKNFGFDKEQPFFDLESWVQALSNFKIRVDSTHQRYPIFASSYKNNTIYAIATIPNWKFQDGTYGDYEGVARKIINNEFKLDKTNDDFLPDYQFYGMSEIEPYTRYTNDGDWDSNGYFLLKLNVSRQNNWSNSPYTSITNYGVKNWESKDGPKTGDVYAQYVQPPNKDAKLPYENAGLLQLLKAQNSDGSGRYWINPKKIVVEKNFLNTITYELNDWQLNTHLLMKDLGLNNVTQIKYRTLLNNVRDWIRYSHQIPKEKISKLITLVNQNEKATVAAALKWYIENGMIELEIIRWDFQLFERLKYDALFKNLLKFYGYEFDQLFAEKPIFVCGENTKETKLLPNGDAFNNDFGIDNFAHNIKIISTEENNYRFVNKKKTDSTNVKIRIPNVMLMEMIKSNYFHLPLKWNDTNYNPYMQNSIDFRYIPSAMSSAYGIFYNLNTRTNYKNRKLVKQNETKETNVLNMIYVTVLPIGSLLIIGAGAVCFAWIKRRRF